MAHIGNDYIGVSTFIFCNPLGRITLKALTQNMNEQYFSNDLSSNSSAFAKYERK